MLNKIKDFANFIKNLNDNDEKINFLNQARELLHEVSPLNHHPVDFVKWQKSEKIEGNEYNPNSVAPPEMKLLIKSIQEDGYTMPIVTYNENEDVKIIDGFHRRKSERTDAQIHKSTMGYIPTTSIRETQQDLSNRMASTIRHNRARGTHDIDLMVNIVKELSDAGMSDMWIMKHIGMDSDEILRLKQVSGLASLFKDNEFSKAWE